MPDTYVPMAWPADSKLSAEEQKLVEVQRRELWDEGVRKEPQLTEMAFLFAATVAAFKSRAAR